MKDFIPFELAYQLKELEFDEECLGFYDAYNGDSHLFLHDRYKPLWLVRTWRRLFSKSSEETTFVNQSYVEYINGVCLAPTFSQAFRFFREKYKLVHEICEHPKEMIDYVASASKGERYLPTYSYGYSSGGCYRPIGNTYIYEEGEIGCLKKFIEIVK